ncbi:hypothetical protein DITRI_Ditri17bG0117900 [Diplodiscus trichospermus]
MKPLPGEHCLAHTVQMDKPDWLRLLPRSMELEDHSGVYVLLSNLYAESGKHYDAKRIKQMMKNQGVNKAPGCSSIKINGMVHEFIAGEKSHQQMEEIHLILGKLDKQLDYAGEIIVG